MIIIIKILITMIIIILMIILIIIKTLLGEKAISSSPVVYIVAQTKGTSA